MTATKTALQHEVSQLKSEIDRMTTINARLTQDLENFKKTGWNEQRATKLRMLETFQARFIHIMGSSGSSSSKYQAFCDLLLEFKWIPRTELLQLAAISEEEYYEKIVGELPESIRAEVMEMIKKASS